ncbi:MAG: hypothetical protein KIT60_26015 [Burkholderiaceae bacterium]|nr:hypothetical protein [Burkholderiaceae bacterium]
MSNASDRPVPTQSGQPHSGAGPAQDPSDLGTAYGMEMSIEAPKTGATTDDLDDPLAWIRRWVERHKPA